jgi:hypothetical protein
VFGEKDQEGVNEEERGRKLTYGLNFVRRDLEVSIIESVTVTIEWA